jgi:hypothetical protein
MNKKETLPILLNNKNVIYDGLKKIGTMYWGKSRSGFIMANFENSVFYVIRPLNMEEDLSDSYLLVCIFDNDKKTVDELPNFYPGKEYELITRKFINSFYKENPNKYLVGQSAEDDSIFIII